MEQVKLVVWCGLQCFSWGWFTVSLYWSWAMPHHMVGAQQTRISKSTINIQATKAKLFALGGLGLLVASCQSQEWPATLDAHLGLHNANMKFTMIKRRKDYQTPFG